MRHDEPKLSFFPTDDEVADAIAAVPCHFSEAATVECGEVVTMTADGTYTKGDVVQVPDGRAGIVLQDATSGNPMSVDVTVGAIYEVPKTTSMVMLIGSEIYWDFSANKAHLLHGGDRDFLLGTAYNEDTVGTGTTIKIALNIRPRYTVSLENGFSTIKIQTAGFPNGCGAGRAGFNMQLDATNEAQKVDALSYESVSVVGLAESIVDLLISVTANGTANVADTNIGVANGTHATDGDSITEFCGVHLDGNDLNISLASRDGTTTVAATDSTTDFVASTPFLVQMDMRNLADIQIYVNGVLQLGSTVFKLNNASGPIKLLAHCEKSANATVYNVSLCRGGIRTAQNI